MPVIQFDHYTLRCRDVDVSAKFYEEVLGLRAEKLDAFEFPMRLMFLGENAFVHLMGAGPALDAFLARSAPSLAPNRCRDASNMEHVAFNGTGIKYMIARLKERGVPYVERTLADFGLAQLMFDDPDGVEIEVNFPVAELE